MAILWPATLRLTSYAPPVLEGLDRSGGVSLTGSEQIVESPGGRWAMQVSTLIRDRDTLLAWQSLVARLGGRAGEILMPVTSCLTQPGGALLTKFDEGGGVLTPFDDGLGFVEESVTATLAAPAALNAVSLVIDCPLVLSPGHYIGIEDRFHHIRDIEPLGGTLYRIDIRPWTRAAYEAGTPISLKTAICRMRLKDAKQLQQVVDLGRFARPSLDFVEAF